MALNRAQGVKEKSYEVSARKNNIRLRYNKKFRGGGADFLGLRHMYTGIVCEKQYVFQYFNIFFFKSI